MVLDCDMWHNQNVPHNILIIGNCYKNLKSDSILITIILKSWLIKFNDKLWNIVIDI